MKISGALRSSRVVDAFESVRRVDFLPEGQKLLADQDRPLNIGYGQTNSQPSTVAFMIELLQPQKGDRVLDVGSGSGWTTALLAHIVGEEGKVYGVEIVEELVAFGSHNLNSYSYQNASIELAGEDLGLPSKAPFDRILASAAADSLPATLLDQLTVGGRVVLPVENEIWSVDKQADDGYLDISKYPGFAFVPLLS